MFTAVRKSLQIAMLGTTLVLLFWTLSENSMLAAQSPQPVNKDESGVAIKGYDPVAYFTENRAVKGKKEFEFSWLGARWLFASSGNRELFATNPERYIPKYGGFCSAAMTSGRTVSVDPEAWKIVNGKLYLGYSKASSEKWYKNAAENIEKADMHWRKLQEK